MNFHSVVCSSGVVVIVIIIYHFNFRRLEASII